MDIPPDWKRSSERILARKWRKILVLGAVDRGKSTYCEYLSRRLMEAGLKVAVVDADIGQKDIGPQAAVTLGFPQISKPLGAILPASFYFVGATSPARHLLPAVVGARELVGRALASGADAILVNTTGLIHGIGRILKSYKIESVRPHVIIAIERSGELDSLLHAYRNIPTLRLPPSREAKPKALEQRREARRRAFQLYFATSRSVSAGLDDLIFQRTLLFNGTPLPAPDTAYCERTSEGMIAVSKSFEDKPSGDRVLAEGFEANLLCGLADRRGIGMGLGIIEEIDFKARRISLLTPVPSEQMRIVQFGELHVTRDGEELPRRQNP